MKAQITVYSLGFVVVLVHKNGHNRLHLILKLWIIYIVSGKINLDDFECRCGPELYCKSCACCIIGLSRRANTRYFTGKYLSGRKKKNFIAVEAAFKNCVHQFTFFCLQALDSLQKGRDSVSLAGVTEEMKCFTEQCSLGFAQRYLAAQKDAYPIILSYSKKSLEEKEAVVTALSALAALTDGQPDLLDAEGRQILLEAFKKHQGDSLVTRVTICVVRNCCLKHEQNRQDLVKEGVLPLLTGAITRHAGHADLVKEASAALRVMTLDDDVRVTYGHAHEHAKMIVLEHNGLKVLIEAAKGNIT